MAKFLSRLFSSRSSSPKRGSFRGSRSSINEGSRRSAASSNMRAATSLDNLASYYINPKELEKHKLHKASWEGNIDKVARHTKPDQVNAKDQHARVNRFSVVFLGKTACFFPCLDPVASCCCSRTYENSATFSA